MMDRDVAVHIAAVAFKASSDIGNLVGLLKENCTQDEYEIMTRAVASATYMVNHELLEVIFKEFPDIKAEFDDRIRKYGFVI